jgi:MFS family permease
LSPPTAEPIGLETAAPRSDRSPRREALGLGLLFGTIYFVQGIGEPTEGLIAQPVRAMLKGWGNNAEQIAAFSALLSIPWSLKPLYGLLSDYVPFLGYRRKSYLVVTSAICVISLVALYFFPLPRGANQLLLFALLLPTIAVAFSDVVADGLMIDEGQPRGLTGRLQSIQWSAMYASTVVAGALGGWLAQRNMESFGFLICGALTMATFIASVTVVRERRVPAQPGAGAAVTSALEKLRRAAKTPVVLSVAGFLFLWNFNPFQHAILYVHMTDSLGMTEQFFGNTVSVLAIASIVASLTYGLYCRRLNVKMLVHLSIVTGILATLAYWKLDGETSAMVITAIVGFTYMTGSMVQLDLAARSCPPESAATVFALLMALSNLAMALSTWIGGALYESMKSSLGPVTAFDCLVGIGALFTAGCWLFLPVLNKFTPKDVAV